MNKRSSFAKELKLPFLMFITSLILLIFGSSILMTPKHYYFSQLDEGWSVSRGNKTLENVTLSTYELGSSYKGEKITISNTLPRKTMLAPSIMFKSRLAAVDVSIDGEDVHTYGHEYLDRGKFVPKKYNIITMENTTKERTISITYTLFEDNAFTFIDPVLFGTRDELVKDFLQSHRLPIFVGSFFIMYACILLALMVYLSLTRKKDFSLLSSAGISLLFGVYTFSYNNIFCFISDHDYFFSLIEYFSLYLFPFAITILLFITHPNIAPKSQKMIIAVNVLLPLTFLVLMFTDRLNINLIVLVLQIFAVLEIIILLPQIILDMYREHKEKINSSTYTGVDADSYLLLGFILLIIFGFFEILKFNVTKYTVYSDSIFANVNFITLGSLYFVYCLFVYYFFNSIDHINSRYVKERLEGLAYTDALTGLMNRAKCTQYITSINVPYAIISIDLDRLKRVNDTFGHIEGDKMIKAFSDLLKESFVGASLIGRNGGDEFMVVYENPEPQTCESAIRLLQEKMAEFNKGTEKFTLSASAGFALSSEVANGKYEDVFYLADGRMYRMKEEHHG